MTRLENINNIPAELRSSPRWVGWRTEDRDGKLTKVPYCIDGRRASVSDPNTFTDFDSATTALVAGKYTGVGFVFTDDDDIVGVDLDHCRNPESGELANWAEDIVVSLNSYSEISPSGTGLHILVHGQLRPGRRRKGGVEMYDSGRYFTVTGQHVEGSPTTVERREEELCELHRSLFNDEEKVPSPRPAQPNQLGDEELIRRAIIAANGPAFERLWRGDWSGNYDSQSEADQALVNHLVFWGGGDGNRVDRLFRQSGLMRPKWDERHSSDGGTYGELTIQTGLAAVTDYYHPRADIDLASGSGRAAETPGAWPEPPVPITFSGFAGELVDAFDSHTEADPVAVLINILVAFGNAVGERPHIMVGATRHGSNLFVTLVGETAKARKGESWSPVNRLFRLADPDWAQFRVKSGLSTGEGLITQVRDPVIKSVPIKDKGRIVEYEDEIVDPGEDDKRLLVVESELAGAFAVMARSGNTLSPVLRVAWDKGDLSTLVKTNPLRATGAHISVIGHITVEELRRVLDEVQLSNGFANRFLFFAVRRSKLLPEPPPLTDNALADLATELTRRIAGARQIDEVSRSPDASKLWREVYPDLSKGEEGLVGTVLARAEAQVTRLSLVYALLDVSATIEVHHLQAALGLWDYCERSAEYIFGGRLGDRIADTILAALKQSQRLTRTEISGLLGHHENSGRIKHALESLKAKGLARTYQEGSDGGRSVEYWELAR